MEFLRILYLVAYIYHADSCLRHNPKARGIQGMLGPVTVQPYQGVDHMVTNPDELACTFDSSCCWNNGQAPVSTLQWNLISGTVDPRLFKNTFHSKVLPNGNFLGAFSQTGKTGAPQTAQLYSCPIRCTKDQVTIAFNHWQTKGVKTQVCLEDTPQGPPTNCQPLTKKNGEMASVTFPPLQNKRIVIISEGFTDKKGSLAIVDDINAHFTPCGALQPVQPTQASVPSGPPACTAITCNFEAGNPCSYSNAVGGGSKPWQVAQAPFMNPLTGIPKAADGSHFAGTYLAPGDTADMSTNVNFPENYVVQFFGYRATEGVDLMACCGSPGNCPFSTTNQVQVSDYRNWKPATISCPRGTKRIVFQARNSGKNYGAVGLDNIRLLNPGGGQAAC